MTETKIVVDGVEMTTRRFLGWKEITSYMELERRTIRRLEQEQNFPIRRMPGKQGRVFMYSHEADAWLAAHCGKWQQPPAGKSQNA